MISNLDALKFMQRLESEFAETPLFLYLDPPYYEKGADLYLSTYEHEDHAAVGTALQTRRNHYWAVTYDDVPAVRKIYARHRLMPFKLRYSANNRRQGKELLILPNKLVVPANLLTRGASARMR
jgi:DNA adenine methylase